MNFTAEVSQIKVTNWKWQMMYLSKTHLLEQSCSRYLDKGICVANNFLVTHTRSFQTLIFWGFTLTTA